MAQAPTSGPSTHDLGQVLRFGAYLSGLQRTKVGSGAPNMHALRERPLDDMDPLKEALTSFPRIDLTSEEFEALPSSVGISKKP